LSVLKTLSLLLSLSVLVKDGIAQGTLTTSAGMAGNGEAHLRYIHIPTAATLSNETARVGELPFYDI
jgi:hypothetical protein